MRTIRMTTILAALALLAAGRNAWASLQGGAPEDTMATLSVPKMSSPPVIDGRIGRREWRESTAVSGVANCRDDVLLPDPTTFYLGWDGGHLYFACRTYLQPGYKPRVKGRSQGLAYIWDDALDLKQKLIWQEFVGVRQLYAESGAQAPDLDYYDGRLTVRGLPARGGRLVAIRRY